MRFAFGNGFSPTKFDEFRAVARAADDAGFAMTMTGDSPALGGDHYVGLAMVALSTTRARIGSYISNPVTRHPVVAAAAIASVNEIAGGRAFLGLSTGDSGVYNLGLKPATQAQLEEYIVTIKTLFEKGEAQFQGTTVHFGWSRRPVPIYMAPGGPKGLRLAGRIADGVFLETGFIPEVIEDTLQQLADAAREAGRSIDDLDIWWHARASFGESIDDAIDQIPSGILGIGNRLARFQKEGKFIPDEIWPRLQELKRRYDFMGHHERPDQTRPTSNAGMLDELGLREYLSERFAIVGTPEDFVTRIRRLESLGVRNIAFSGLMPDKLGFIETVRSAVMPHLPTH
jgi:5,10-methylenetetrahydromethanopterin reductase